MCSKETNWRAVGLGLGENPGTDPDAAPTRKAKRRRDELPRGTMVLDLGGSNGICSSCPEPT